MKKLNYHGETIVEVLMVLLILGAAMTTAFSATGRASNNNVAAQERSEAAAYGQEQIERLKNLLASNDPTLSTTFCIDGNNHVVDITDTVNGGCVDSTASRYGGYFSFDSNTQTYTENVRWDSIGTVGRDQLQLVYRTEYLNDATAGAPAPTPGPTATDPCPASGIPTGALQACYYNDTSFGRFALNRTEFPVGQTVANANATNVLNDDFGLGSPSSVVDTDNFSGRYQGKFNFAAGLYTFTAGANDGVQLYIDGTLVIDQFHQQALTTYQAIRGFATAGLHDVRLDFYENSGAAAAVLNWKLGTMLPRTGLIWSSSAGADVSQAKMSTGRNYCWQIDETSEPASHSWQDNYLCSDQDLGIQWSHTGPVSGKYCAHWSVPSDPYTWNNNYLCSASDLGLTFNVGGVIAGQNCLPIDEPNDPDGGGVWQTGGPHLCETPTVVSTTVEAETFTSLNTVPAAASVAASDPAASGSVMQQFLHNDSITRTVNLPAFQSIQVRARGDQYIGPPVMTVTIDGTPVMAGQPVANTSYGLFTANTPTAYAAGSHTITMTYSNDTWCGVLCRSQDRNLYIDYISFTPSKSY